jgi:hypothetical protein
MPERAATQLPVEVAAEVLEPYAERAAAAQLSFTKQHARHVPSATRYAHA